jgi:hypothetical protein
MFVSFRSSSDGSRLVDAIGPIPTDLQTSRSQPPEQWTRPSGKPHVLPASVSLACTWSWMWPPATGSSARCSAPASASCKGLPRTPPCRSWTRAGSRKCPSMVIGEHGFREGLAEESVRIDCLLEGQDRPASMWTRSDDGPTPAQRKAMEEVRAWPHRRLGRDP